MKYIDDNFLSPVTLSEAAERACLSPCHFSRIFKEVMGVSFKFYLIDLRIAKAKELLAQSMLRIAEVGAAVGYDDVAHFVKLFKQYTGFTPTQYRRLCTGALPSSASVAAESAAALVPAMK